MPSTWPLQWPPPLRALGEGWKSGGRSYRDQSQRTFVFAATDYTAFALLPPLMNRLQHSAPGVRLRLVNAERKLSVEALASGRIDFALGCDRNTSACRGIRPMTGSPTATMVGSAARPPAPRRGTTLEGYLAERHG